jgi:hypothetical protein
MATNMNIPSTTISATELTAAGQKDFVRELKAE